MFKLNQNLHVQTSKIRVANNKQYMMANLNLKGSTFFDSVSQKRLPFEVER